MLHNKGTGAKPELVLVNASGNGGRDRCYTFPYGVFEEAILGRLKEVDPQDVLPDRAEEASRADIVRAQLDVVRQDLAGLKQDLAQRYSKALADVLRDREEREEKIGQELQEEMAKSVRPAERAWGELPSLVDMIRQGGDEARLKLRPVLRRVIEEARMLIVPRGSYRLCVVQVFFAGGQRQRSYVILYQPAANRRPGGWQVEDFADLMGGGDFDLRKPPHVLKLVQRLEAIKPARLSG